MITYNVHFISKYDIYVYCLSFQMNNSSFLFEFRVHSFSLIQNEKRENMWRNGRMKRKQPSPKSWSWHMYRSKMNLNCVLKSKFDKIITMIFEWIPFSIISSIQNSMENSYSNTNNDIVSEYMKYTSMWWTKQIKLFIKWNAAIATGIWWLVSWLIQMRSLLEM